MNKTLDIIYSFKKELFKDNEIEQEDVKNLTEDEVIFKYLKEINLISIGDINTFKSEMI